MPNDKALILIKKFYGWKLFANNDERSWTSVEYASMQASSNQQSERGCDASISRHNFLQTFSSDNELEFPPRAGNNRTYN